MFLFRHMIYSVCLLGSLCESKYVSTDMRTVLENKLLCAETKTTKEFGLSLETVLAEI